MAEDFSRRSMQPELMDTEKVSFEEFHECLRMLEIINVFTLAYRPTLSWFRCRLSEIDVHQSLSVIDIGSGGGDMLRRLWKLSVRTKRMLALTGVDLNPWSKKSAELSTPPDATITFETANLFSLPPDRQADFIISSLFTHHLTKEECIDFIKWMDKHAKRAWFINDLHRNWLPFWFIKYTTRIFFKNRLIRHDAPVSVARAFTTADWRLYLAEAGIPEARTEIKWFFPFRFGVACRKL